MYSCLSAESVNAVGCVAARLSTGLTFFVYNSGVTQQAADWQYAKPRRDEEWEGRGGFEGQNTIFKSSTRRGCPDSILFKALNRVQNVNIRFSFIRTNFLRTPRLRFAPKLRTLRTLTRLKFWSGKFKKCV